MNEPLKKLLQRAGDYAGEYIDGVRDRPVFPAADAIAGLDAFDEPMPEHGLSGEDMLAKLHAFGAPATTAQSGGRYFGFVNGGIHPPSMAARWLADAWDQNAALYVTSPIASKLESVCERWLGDLFGLPETTAAGFVSGTSTSLACGFAAARNSLLERRGWDVAASGLFSAPEIKVVLGEQAHGTVFKALSLLGLGRDRVHKVRCDDQGRMRIDALPPFDETTLVIVTAGNVNSGSFDHFRPICERADAANAWVHVDGAFGLWAAASQNKAHLCDGMEAANSWSVDAHKTLNAPYDCGVILCRERAALVSAMQATGAYIQWSEDRDGMLYTPEMSRRARGIDLWATLVTMGQAGVAELVDQLCDRAQLFAKLLLETRFRVLNEVVFNQVLVACDTPAQTTATLAAIQARGECWCGGSQWLGEPVIRVSVCSAATTEDDVRRSAQAFVRARDDTIQ